MSQKKSPIQTNPPVDGSHSDASVSRLNQSIGNARMGPSYQHPVDCEDCDQAPVDLIDETSMESFPCSDPPAYSTSKV